MMIVGIISSREEANEIQFIARVRIVTGRIRDRYNELKLEE